MNAESNLRSRSCSSLDQIAKKLARALKRKQKNSSNWDCNLANNSFHQNVKTYIEIWNASTVFDAAHQSFLGILQSAIILDLEHILLTPASSNTVDVLHTSSFQSSFSTWLWVTPAIGFSSHLPHLTIKPFLSSVSDAPPRLLLRNCLILEQYHVSPIPQIRSNCSKHSQPCFSWYASCLSFTTAFIERWQLIWNCPCHSLPLQASAYTAYENLHVMKMCTIDSACVPYRTHISSLAPITFSFLNLSFVFSLSYNRNHWNTSTLGGTILLQTFVPVTSLFTSIWNSLTIL